MDAINGTEWEEAFVCAYDKLTQAKEEYEALLKEIQQSIEEHGETSTIGSTVTLTIVERGPKFSFTQDADEKFLKQEQKIDTEKVEQYLEDHGSLPRGITHRERTTSLTPYFSKHLS